MLDLDDEEVKWGLREHEMGLDLEHIGMQMEQLHDQNMHLILKILDQLTIQNNLFPNLEAHNVLAHEHQKLASLNF